MKIACVTDTHSGARSDNPRVQDNSKKFYDEVYFPELKKRGITTAIHLGDMMDRRKYVNINTAYRNRVDFVEPHEEIGCRLYTIIGNHDVYYRETLKVNSVQELYGWNPNVVIIEDIQTLKFDGLDILMVPWMCASNIENSLHYIQESRAPVCFGHLELDGFEMYRGIESKGGMSPDIFSKFDVVASGHFHHRSQKGNIHYLGSHSEFTWADYGDERGFHVFDTDTREFEFIPNPFNLHEKLFWTEELAKDPASFSEVVKKCSGKYVKVIVQYTGSPELFGSFIEAIEETDPIEIQPVDDHLNAGLIIDDLEVSGDAEDTLTIFKKTFEDAPVDKDRLEKLVTSLYLEAMNIQ